MQGSGWYRFAFFCDVTGNCFKLFFTFKNTLTLKHHPKIPLGGTLKTTADIESLSANWFPVKDVMAKKMELR